MLFQIFQVWRPDRLSLAAIHCRMRSVAGLVAGKHAQDTCERERAVKVYMITCEYAAVRQGG